MRIYLLLVGIIISSVNLFFMLLYISIINSGYSLFYFFKYLLTHLEIYLFLIGIFMIFLSIKERKKIN